MGSRRGNQRAEYLHYEDAFQKTLVIFKSSDGHSLDHSHRNSKYNVYTNPIRCHDNQIMTAYLHSADIPMTTFNINKNNNTLYLYLPDWNTVNFSSGVGNGIIPVVLTPKNYTVATLRTELQAKLDALVDTAYATKFTLASAGISATDAGGADPLTAAGYTYIASTNYSLHHAGADNTALVTALVGVSSLPIPTIGNLYTKVWSDQGATLLSYTTVGGSNKVSSSIWGAHSNGVGGYDATYVRSQPRFAVTFNTEADGERLVIKRTDVMGLIGSTTTLTSPTWKLSASKSNYLHFGLNKPIWISVIPSRSNFALDVYNSSGLSDSTAVTGSIMRSFYKATEFAADSAKFAGNQSMFFPNVPNVNAHSTILIRSKRLRANVQDGGKMSDIIAKIPVSVQQGDIINYEPRNPIRFNLGQSAEVENIDITITDRDNCLVDFNGNPHDITILFEVWEVASIPLGKQNQVAVRGEGTKTLMGQLPQMYDLDNGRMMRSEPIPIPMPSYGSSRIHHVRVGTGMKKSKPHRRSEQPAPAPAPAPSSVSYTQRQSSTL